MSGKYALIIGNSEYVDTGLAKLTAPRVDTDEFARVLNDQNICAFDQVNVLVDQPSSTIIEAIDEFFDQKKPDDLLVLYFSGHGVRDELGSLYLAAKNTLRSRLRSTAIKSDYIRDVMDQSRSRRQVLILDCCNSGAFAQGTKAATGVSIGTASAFEGGYGRVILTASDSTQFAWEGEKVIGETSNSLFTHFLIEGLQGEADLDGDGRITVDELYDYAYEKVRLVTPGQTPSKFSTKQQGEVILRQNIPTEEIKSIPLPTPLLHAIDNPFADVRLGAVQQLAKILAGKNIGLARSAREQLEKLAEKDDSRAVARAASQALETIRQSEPMEISTTNEATSPPEVEQVKHPLPLNTPITSANANSIFWITLGWTVAGAVGGAVYYGRNAFSSNVGQAIGGAVGWAIGGFILARTLAHTVADRTKTVWVVLGWAAAGAIGWAIGDVLTEASGAAVGATIGVIIGMVVTSRMYPIVLNWQSVFWIILAWALGGAIGWSISKGVQDAGGYVLGLDIGKVAGWSIGRAIGGFIGGIVLGWQINKQQPDR